MEMSSPLPCPPTTTVRRNPPRKARTTPFSGIALREARSTQKLIPSFPLKDILSEELPQNPNNNHIASDLSPPPLSENLKVYLRIRPANILKSSANVKTIPESKNAWPKNPKTKPISRPKVNKITEICVQVNDDMRSVTVTTPQAMQERKRSKSEIYEGFSRVFPSESTQSDVYEQMVKPLVDDFLKGKCGMLAAMGPSGSGKTHTVFGSSRDPGMVPLALRRIFEENESSGSKISRSYYLSMLEISLEGKGERLIDLLHDGCDVSMQQLVVKGLQEVVVCDVQQAEALIARGMLKRATATTNSNNQSSRSQCIINIRNASKNGDGEDDGKPSPVLSIVDLAGAEREKKTGNQGARLLESNFINNTSMVFGLCLRSLLEHQKNRNKPLQKHYQNSLLTKYMRDYLEGRKRMMLILTVKPGVEDYLDTSYLLRQAAPFTKIKFKSLEEPANLTLNKRPNQAVLRVEQLKRMKISEGNTGRAILSTPQEIAEKVVANVEIIEDIGDENLTEIPVLSGESVMLDIKNKSPPHGDRTRNKCDNHQEREYQILQGLSKAMWTVLKQYKKEVEGLKSENCHLKESLIIQKSRSMDLENELTSEKMRPRDLDSELKELKANLEVLSYCPKKSERCENEKETDHSVRDASATSYLCSDEVKMHYPQELEGLSESNDDAQDVKGSADTVVVHSTSQDHSVTTNDDQDLKLTSACLHTSCNCEEDALESVGDSNMLESESESVSDGSTHPASLECESVNNTSDYKDSNGMPTELQAVRTDDEDQISSATAHSDDLLDSSISSEKDVIALVVEEEPLNKEEDKEQLYPRVIDLTKGNSDVKLMSKCVHALSSATAHSDNLLDSSSISSRKDVVGLGVEEEQPNKEEDEGQLNPLVTDLTKEASPIEGQLYPQVIDLTKGNPDVKSMSKSVPELSSGNIQNTGKPKRRLLPASSVLLRDISIVDVEDENAKPKGGRGKKTGAIAEMNKTQGSLSLLRMLKTKN